MNELFEEDGVYNEAHAKELLQVQTLYNQKLQALNNELAKQKSDLSIKYMNAAKGQAATATSAPAQPNQPNQTGTVNNAGQPTNAQGNVKTVESYNDILAIRSAPVNELAKEVIPKPSYPGDKSNWYNRADTQADRLAREARPVVHRTPRAPSYASDAYWKRKDAKDKLEGEIADLQQNLDYYTEKFDTPRFKGVNAEIEEFFAGAGFEASDILNQGIPRKEKIKELKEKGIDDAEDLVDNYYYYFPQYDDETAKERHAAEKEAAKLQKQLDAKEKRLEKYMYESVKTSHINEAVYNVSEIDPEEYSALKNYLDAENISYIEDETDGTIEFDDTDVDDEWIQRLPEAPEPATSNSDDILTIEPDDETESVADLDDKIDEEKVFYVKILNGTNFTGKIYKLFNDGDWRAKVVKGKSDTFEKLNYDPDWDEFDIIAFLRKNYDNAEIIDEDEFNDKVEESLMEQGMPSQKVLKKYHEIKENLHDNFGFNAFAVQADGGLAVINDEIFKALYTVYGKDYKQKMDEVLANIQHYLLQQGLKRTKTYYMGNRDKYDGDVYEFSNLKESFDGRSHDPRYPYSGDTYVIKRAVHPDDKGTPYILALGTHTQNFRGTGTYQFKVGDILTFDDSNNYDSSFWITPDGKSGRIWCLALHLVDKGVIEKEGERGEPVKFKSHSIPTLDEYPTKEDVEYYRAQIIKVGTPKFANWAKNASFEELKAKMLEFK